MSLKHETGNRALDSLRNFVRYQTHGGYVWAAVLSDGELMCEKCAAKHYRAIYTATRDNLGDGWRVLGLAHSGDAHGETARCCQCQKPLWEHWSTES